MILKESRFFEPPWETNIGTQNCVVREIGGYNYVVRLRREKRLLPSYREVRKIECSRIQD